jgi:hypothetical protein
MSTLRVRAYNVRFGDALLVSVPEKAGTGDVTRHILIDVGNVLSGRGGDESVFEPVIKDIQAQLQGQPVDLYVMTHEHMDHVKGLRFAAHELNLTIAARYAWLTASAAEDYYDRFPTAKEQRRKLVETFEAIERYFAAAPEAATPWIRALLANNDPRKTADCVRHLRQVAPADKTTYVYRGCNLAGRHPFTEASFEVWAPEENTSDYYGRFQPMALGIAPGGQANAKPTLVNPVPPAGVDAGAFYDLVNARRRGWGDNFLAIDQAANNTSVVFCLTWRGWRLLFCGDAEQRSWKTMAKKGVLQPVHFLKVGHHGSHNGTPLPELLAKILPLPAPDARRRQAVLCTCEKCYSGVPDDDTRDELARRCNVRSVEDVGDGEFVDLEFPDKGP